MNVLWGLELEDARLVLVALNAAAQRARNRVAQGEHEQGTSEAALTALHDELAATIQAARQAAGRPVAGEAVVPMSLHELRRRLRDQPETNAARVGDLLDLVEIIAGREP